jgi:hypothetical protein
MKETILKPGLYRKKLKSIMILSGCLMGLEILGQLVMFVGHIDFTTFITVETFMLTNLTAFTTLYEFLENRANKRKEEHGQ